MQYSSFNEIDVIAGWHTELDKLVSSSVAQKTKLIPRMFTGFWVIEFDFFQSGTRISDVYRFLGYRVPYFPVGPE